ncbi:uncharacterized protein LOC143275927 isoform X2 [Babylonia areolata]|uniref:uncharacterized protein LOC143275927 isoform X2 n=1 Tax=Babylonia areolata TaxID=304850 RepID=UPI003FD45878
MADPKAFIVLLIVLISASVVIQAQCRSGPDLCGREQNVCMVSNVPYCCPGQYMTLSTQGTTVISCRCQSNGELGAQCVTYAGRSRASTSVVVTSASASGMTCALLASVLWWWWWL